MAYAKKTWIDGEIVYAPYLNNMENGISAAHEALDGGAAQSSALARFNSTLEFPNVGDAQTLYIVTAEGSEGIYVWDPFNSRYKTSPIGSNFNNITTISGGNANG